MSDKTTATASGSGTAAGLRVAILTIGDPGAAGAAPDAGPAIQALLEQHGVAVPRRWVVPDDLARIDDAVIDFTRDAGADALLTTGGTGLKRLEHGLEAVGRRFTKRIEGFRPVFHALLFQERGPAAFDLRADAGIAGGKPVFALPSDEAACMTALKGCILPGLARLVAACKGT
jgi:molybdenum cofactor biosynthesis protein B